MLVMGKPGAGKTQICLDLCERAYARSIPFGFVSDDQTKLTKSPELSILASCPARIEGRLEIRFFGVVDHREQASAEVPLKLVVRLAEVEDCDRFQKGNCIELGGISLPHLKLPKGQSTAAVRAIFAALGYPILPHS